MAADAGRREEERMRNEEGGGNKKKASVGRQSAELLSGPQQPRCPVSRSLDAGLGPRLA